MKTSFLIITGIMVITSLMFFSCKKKDPQKPCDNKGQVWLTNKLDSTATIQIVQLNLIFDLEKDHMQNLVLEGDNPYTFNITSKDFWMDSTFMVLVCDDKEWILEKP
ncbi:MAG: hypothetical protein V1733_05765 [bacterium]